MSADDAPIIELRGVRKAFGSNVVIERLDLSVGRGEIVALLGQTGSGKSTVLNIVMGTIPADAGSVRVAGNDPFRQFARLRGKLAVSFQTDRLLPWRTAVENAEIGLLVLGMHKARAREIAQTWLDRVKLAGAGDLFPHQLSGGMRQRVSLARALCVDPDLVLLDESFSQLDHVTSRTLRTDFSTIAREFNKTCLFVTHRIDDAVEMADRVLVLRPGAGIALEEHIDESIRSSPDRRSALHDQIAAVMGHEA